MLSLGHIDVVLADFGTSRVRSSMSPRRVATPTTLTLKSGGIVASRAVRDEARAEHGAHDVAEHAHGLLALHVLRAEALLEDVEHLAYEGVFARAVVRCVDRRRRRADPRG